LEDLAWEGGAAAEPTAFQAFFNSSKIRFGKMGYLSASISSISFCSRLVTACLRPGGIYENHPAINRAAPRTKTNKLDGREKHCFQYSERTA
jgi:hypothetical protein